MNVFDNFIYKIGAIVAILFLLVCMMGYFSDIRRRRSERRNQSNPEEGNQIQPRIAEEESLDWNFPIKLDIVDKVSSPEEFQLYFSQPCSIQSNYPLNPNQDKCYFEVKLLDLPDETTLYLGLSKNITDNLTIPGVMDDSLSIESKKGSVLLSGKSLDWINGRSFNSGDVIGCLVAHRLPSQVTFTHNGELLEPLPMVNSQQLFPTLYSTGNCRIQFNFGHNEFLYSKANLFKYGLASTSTLSELPPAYISTDNPSTSSPPPFSS